MKNFMVISLVIMLSVCSTFNKKKLNSNNVQLPDRFFGTFQWKNSNEIQNVSVFLTSVNSNDKEIIALGNGKYNVNGRITNIKIKMIVNNSTREIRIWESDPDGSAFFVTNGSHIGTINSNFTEINAVWTTEDTGDQGNLILSSQN